MKSVLAVAVFVLTAAVVPASAQKMNADDIKWINQCIDDNKGEAGATPAIARKYCSCMNEKMDSKNQVHHPMGKVASTGARCL